MTKGRGAKGLATAALLLAVASACAHEAKDPAASGSPTPTSPTPSTASTPTSDAEVASLQASDLVRSYFAVLDDLRQHSQKPLSGLSKVATSIQLSSQKKLLHDERRNGLHQVGGTKIRDLKVQSVELDNSAPSAGKVPTVVIDACWDVSDADLVDKGGKSVVSPGRRDIGWTRYTVANYHWATERNNGWRVASGQDLKQTPCAAS